jgi:hypothetical protein
MRETTGLLNKIRPDDQVAITLNANCAVPLPEQVVSLLSSPHRLTYYYFQYLERGSVAFPKFQPVKSSQKVNSSTSVFSCQSKVPILLAISQRRFSRT